ncbi:hypothetical protein DFH09DRAFT_1067843 [Mycena vulgaris]|nr:hypothetical protein DFH09DRAFT_1067843 [Mycena vulgaris]
MAPIRLKSWVPRNTKPTNDWKARNAEQMSHFNAAFANKEYVQSVVGQILKDLQVKEWSDWQREDLKDMADNKRELRKRALIDSHPDLLTGPHGRPSFGGQRQAVRRELSPFTTTNNHLDDAASFDSFAVDGYSTSTNNKWAVGEKGKGFILATQYWFETIETQMRARKPGFLSPDLRRPGYSYPAESLKHRYHLDIDDAPDGGDPQVYDVSLETSKMRDKAATVLAQAWKGYGLDRPDASSAVKADEKQTQPTTVPQPLVPPHQAPVPDDGSEAALNRAAWR